MIESASYFSHASQQPRALLKWLPPLRLISRVRSRTWRLGLSFLLGNALSGAAHAQSTLTHLWSWGGNSDGQLGDGSTLGRNRPAEVPPNRWLLGAPLADVAAGKSHSLALTRDGRVLAWGGNNYGQLGTANTLNFRTPTPIRNDGPLAGRRFSQLRSGKYHALALDTQGALWEWGYNFYGQLGDGTALNRPRAIRPRLPIASIETMAGGGSHSIALSLEGQLLAWGNNGHGALGNGSGRGSSLPVAVDSSGVLRGRRMVALAAGNYHCLALDSEGRVYAWGDNQFGQIGDGSTLTRTRPVAVSGALLGRRVVSIAAGYFFSLALTSDGQLFAWGANESGQIGDGSTLTRPYPTKLYFGRTPIVRMAAGFSHALAVDASGAIWSWGANRHGELGDGTFVPHLRPRRITLTGLTSGSQVIALAAGEEHSLVVTMDASFQTLSNAVVGIEE